MRLKYPSIYGVSHFLPTLAAEVRGVITILLLSHWQILRELHGAKRAGNDTGLLSVRPTLFFPKGCVETKVTVMGALQGYVEGKFFKRVLKHLDPGEVKIFLSLMDQGASQHTRHAPLTLFGIDDNISLDRWRPGFFQFFSLLCHFHFSFNKEID